MIIFRFDLEFGLDLGIDRQTHGRYRRIWDFTRRRIGVHGIWAELGHVFISAVYPSIRHTLLCEIHLDLEFINAVYTACQKIVRSF